MKPSIGFVLIFIFLLCWDRTEGKSTPSCVRDCDGCKKECNKLHSSGFDCSFSKPRKSNDHCTCTGGYQRVPICGGTMGFHPSWKMNLGLPLLTFFVTIYKYWI